MELERRLSRRLLEGHPADAARALESLPADEAPAVVTEAGPEAAAEVLRAAPPHFAAAVLTRIDPARAAEIAEALPFDIAAALLRRMEESPREAILASVADRCARSLRSLLRFPEGTAGSWMDPRVVALPQDLDAERALQHLRDDPEHTLYNLYVVDAEQRLVGALNLRELLVARRRDTLASVMQPAGWRLRADADRHAIVSHPGWRTVHSLPVVDGQGMFLGALRYRTLRRLQEEMSEDPTAPGTATVQALGDLFWTGVAGLIDAMATGAAAAAPEPLRRR
jgi:magnesium transporter